jgi:hypothetical protein
MVFKELRCVLATVFRLDADSASRANLFAGPCSTFTPISWDNNRKPHTILELLRGKLLVKEIEKGEVRDDVKARRVNTTFERKKASE